MSADQDPAGHVPANGLHGIFAKLATLGICDSSPTDVYALDLADFYVSMMREYVADLPIIERYSSGPGANVLDLACGAGRISIALAKKGYCVIGLDNSQAMLDLAGEALEGEDEAVRGRLDLRCGDMTEFELGRQFDLIVVGITSISLLLTSEARLSMMRCVRRHLAPGGSFVFDILSLEDDEWERYDNYHDVWSAESERGTDVCIIGQKFYPADRRFVFTVYREEIGWEGECRRTIGYSEKAWLRRSEIREEISAAGLRLHDERREGDQVYFVARDASDE